MTKLSTTPIPPWVLVLGAGGSGKTRLLGTFCEYVPTVIITADLKGLQTIKTMGLDPEYFLVEDWSKIWNVYEDVARYCKDNAVKCIALDDITKVQDTDIEKSMKQPQNWNERNQASKGTANFELQVMKDTMEGNRRLELQQRGNMNIGLDAFITQIFKLAPPIKVMTALEDLREHPRTGQEHLYPLVEGGLRYELPSEFSLVINTFVYEDKGAQFYCATSRSNSRLSTKDRYSLTGGRTWINPTGEKLLAYMAGKGEKETKLEADIGVGMIAKPTRVNN